jgi:hypothetical protein
MANDAGPELSDEQFRRLAGYGEIENAEAGRQLYVSGDNSYDFFLLGTAAVDIVRDATVVEPPAGSSFKDLLRVQRPRRLGSPFSGSLRGCWRPSR